MATIFSQLDQLDLSLKAVAIEFKLGNLTPDETLVKLSEIRNELISLESTNRRMALISASTSDPHYLEEALKAARRMSEMAESFYRTVKDISETVFSSISMQQVQASA